MAAPYNVFVGQTDDDSNFADVTLFSDDVEIKNLTTLVKSLKVSSLEERKCPQSCNPSRIVELLKYLATITTDLWPPIICTSAVRTARRHL